MLKSGIAIAIVIPWLLAVLTICPSTAYGDQSQALIDAVQNGDSNQVRLLLDKGVDPNPKDQHNVTALILASLEGEFEIARLLLDKGANVNAKDKSGRTA